MDEYRSLIEAGLRVGPRDPVLVLKATLPTRREQLAYEAELVKYFIIERGVAAQTMVNAGFPEGHKGIRRALRWLDAQS